MQSRVLMRNIGIGILVVVVIAGAYIFLVKDSEESTALLTTSPGSSDILALPGTAAVTADSQELREITAVLNQLKSISIDVAIFDDPAFRSLTDFNLEIAPQSQGRVNPFLPGDGVKAE